MGEIQRTMLELLNQLDGFDARTDVKVILATNKIETLDPALIRPGRIDRKIEFPAPDQKTRRHIFQIHTGKMNLSADVDLEEFIMSKEELSGADIKAMCTEAGLLALRERRMRVSQAEFKKAKEYVMYKKRRALRRGSTCEDAPCLLQQQRRAERRQRGGVGVVHVRARRVLPCVCCCA